MADEQIIYELRISTQQPVKSMQDIIDRYKVLVQGLKQFEDRSSQAYKEFQKEAINAREKIVQFNRELNQSLPIAKRIEEGIIESFKKIGAAILAYVAFDKLKQNMDEAIDKTKEFEESMVNVRIFTGATTEQMAELTKETRALGAQSMYSAIEISKLQVVLSKQHFSAGEIKNMTGALLELNEVSGRTATDLPETANLVAQAIHAFNLSAADTGRISDVMSKAFSTSALNVDKMQSGLQNIAPVANEFGFTLEQTISLLALLSNQGFPVNQMGAALRMIMLNMTGDTSKFAKQLHVTATGFNGFIEALDKAKQSGTDLSSVLDVMDKRSAAQFAAVMRNTDGLKQYVSELENSAGTTEYLAGIKFDTLAEQTDILKSKVTELFLSWGDANMGRLRSWVQTLQDSVDWISRNRESITTFIKVMLQAVTAVVAFKTGQLLVNAAIWAGKGIVSAYTMVASSLQLAYAKITGNVEAATVAQSNFNKAMVGNWIGAVLTGITLLIMNWDKITSFFDRFRKHIITAQKDTAGLTEAQKTLTEQFSKESGSMNSLFERLKILTIAQSLTNEQKGEQSRLIKEINDNYGKYLDNLVSEKASIDEITAAQEQANKSLLASIAIKTRNEAIGKLFEGEQEAVLKFITSLREADSTLDAGSLQLYIEKLQKLAEGMDKFKKGTAIKGDIKLEVPEETEADDKLIGFQEKLNKIIFTVKDLPDKLKDTFVGFDESANVSADEVLRHIITMKTNSKKEMEDLLTYFKEYEKDANKAAGTMSPIDKSAKQAKKEMDDEIKAVKNTEDAKREENKKTLLEKELNHTVSVQDYIDYEKKEAAITEEYGKSKIEIYKKYGKQNIAEAKKVETDILKAKVDANKSELTQTITQNETLLKLKKKNEQVELQEIDNKYAKEHEELRKAGATEAQILEAIENEKLIVRKKYMKETIKANEETAIALLDLEYSKITATTKKEAAQQEFEYNQKKLAIEIVSATKELDELKKLKSSTEKELAEAEARLNKLKKQQSDQKADYQISQNSLMKENAKKTVNEIENIWGHLSNFINTLVDIQQRKFENMLKKVDEQMSVHQQNINELDKEIEKADAHEKQILRNKKEFELQQMKQLQEEKDAIEKEALQKRKQWAIAQALINSALSITKTFAEVPFPYSIIVSALIVAETAAQLAAINSQEFKYGGLIPGSGDLSKIISKGYKEGGQVGIVKYDKGNKVGIDNAAGQRSIDYGTGEAIRQQVANANTYLEISRMFKQGGTLPSVLFRTLQEGGTIPLFINEMLQQEGYIPAKRGGVITGPLHGQGGVKFIAGGSFNEAEGGEFISSRKTTKLFLPLLEQLNKIGNASHFKEGGLVTAENMGFFKPIYSKGQDNTKDLEGKFNEMITAVKELKIVFSLVEFNEQNLKYNQIISKKNALP